MMMMIAGLFVFFWGRDGGNDGVNGSSFSLLRANAMKFMTTYHNETIMVARNARESTRMRRRKRSSREIRTRTTKSRGAR